MSEPQMAVASTDCFFLSLGLGGAAALPSSGSSGDLAFFTLVTFFLSSLHAATLYHAAPWVGAPHEPRRRRPPRPRSPAARAAGAAQCVRAVQAGSCLFHLSVCVCNMLRAAARGPRCEARVRTRSRHNGAARACAHAHYVDTVRGRPQLSPRSDSASVSARRRRADRPPHQLDPPPPHAPAPRRDVGQRSAQCGHSHAACRHPRWQRPRLRGTSRCGVVTACSPAPPPRWLRPDSPHPPLPRCRRQPKPDSCKS